MEEESRPDKTSALQCEKDFDQPIDQSVLLCVDRRVRHCMRDIVEKVWCGRGNDGKSDHNDFA